MTLHVDREVPAAIPRFDRVERAAHWTTAVLFGVLMLTGAVLYAGPFSTLFGTLKVADEVEGVRAHALVGSKVR